MNKLAADILSLVLIAATIVFALVLYPGLPDPMPSHWNAAGEVDGYMSKPWGVAILPLAAVFIFVLMKVIPRISPKGFRTDEFSAVLSLFQAALVTFICGVAVLVLLEAKGYDTNMDRMIFAGLGLLFVIIGSALGKVRKNFFLGIRTPWTLASDEVWDRTHRLGGKLFMLAGLLLFVNAFVRLSLGWTLGAVFLMLLFPVAYSYFIYRNIEGFGQDDKSG